LRRRNPYVTGSRQGFRGPSAACFWLLTLKLQSENFQGPRGVAAGISGARQKEEALVKVAGGDDTPSGVAGRYATALFELAREEQALDQVEQDLNRFNQALDAVDDLRRLVMSPVFTADEQQRALAAVLDKVKIEGLSANFLKLVARNRRLFATPDMIKAFRTLLARHRGQASAEVISAEKLEEGQIRALQTALKSALHKDVQLEQRVDPTLLGGLIVRVGSRMIDNSLRTKLNSLKTVMKEVG
jgi:F-type H+-transporting ATPase subunit delta